MQIKVPTSSNFW